MKRVRVKVSNNKSKPIFSKRFYFILIGVFIISLMIVSVLQFGSDGESGNTVDDVVDYNGYIFNNVNGRWVLDVNGNLVSFNYLPDEVNDLYLDDIVFNGKAYIAVDPGEDIDSYFIQRVMAILQYKGVLGVKSCIKEDGCGDVPVVSCDMDKDIILFKKGINGVYNDGNCLVLQGDDEGLLKGVDLLYYKLLDVL